MDIANFISCTLAGSPVIDIQDSYPGSPSMTITSGRGNLIIPLLCLVIRSWAHPRLIFIS